MRSFSFPSKATALRQLTRSGSLWEQLRMRTSSQCVHVFNTSVTWLSCEPFSGYTPNWQKEKEKKCAWRSIHSEFHLCSLQCNRRRVVSVNCQTGHCWESKWSCLLSPWLWRGLGTPAGSLYWLTRGTDRWSPAGTKRRVGLNLNSAVLQLHFKDSRWQCQPHLSFLWPACYFFFSEKVSSKPDFELPVSNKSERGCTVDQFKWCVLNVRVVTSRVWSEMK